MFKIGRRKFEIARREFSAHVSVGERGWSASWTIEVYSRPLELADMRWEPVLRSHSELSDLPHPLELSGKMVGPIANDERGEPAFLLYDFEHDPINEPILRFKERKGSKFLFEFRGRAPNFTDVDDDRIVFVSIDCWLPFNGVRVDEFQLEKANQRLRQVFGSNGWPDPVRDGNLWHYKLRPDA